MELYFLALLILIMAMALGSGFPVAFALPGAAIITISAAAATGYIFTGSTDAFFHSGGPQQWLSAGVTNLRGVFWEVERDTLIAIPLFIFMGIMLQRSKIAEDLLVTMAQLFGPVPGGLGISVVFVGALLAATTGIVGATVVAMGLISLPAMLRNNYSPSLATGTIAASGTLGQIIPPSIVLIILADQLASAVDQASTARKLLHKEATGELSMPSTFDVASTSAGEMFLGAFIPGMVLVGLYMVYILVFAILRPKQAPAVGYDGKYDSKFLKTVLITLVPPLALIFLVLGSIISGVATVNQAGAIGAAGAMIMAGYRLPKPGKSLYYPALLAIVALVMIAFVLANFEMNVKAMNTGADRLGIALGAIATLMFMVSLIWSGVRVFKLEETLQGVMLETAKTTALVFIILLGAAMLTAAFRAFGGEELVRDFLNSLPGGFWTQFIIVMLVIFVLGFFLDFIEIAVVVVPIVAPILLADPQANITAVWLGVMIGLNIQTSFLTPPFGFALFYLRGVAPAVVKTVQMYKGVIAFITLQLIALSIVGLYPPLVNYLPNRVSFLSESSPPPRNPKLQLCLEDYVGQQLSQSSVTTDAIAAARGLNLSVLPKDLVKDLTGGLDAADKAVAQLDAAFVAAGQVEEAAGLYRPQLTVVRRIEKQIRAIEAEVKEMKTLAGRMRDEAQAEERAALEAEIAVLEAEIEHLHAQVPDTWEEVHNTFAELTKAENTARAQYRRAADQAWEDPAEVLAVLDANAEFAALETPLRDMRATIETLPEAETEGPVNDLAKLFGKVDGADDVKSLLSKARKALKNKTPDRDAALEQYDAAVAEFEAQQIWRVEADATLRPGLTAYLDGIKETLGIRVQPRFTREQALAMASCNSYHRDISLNF
ncbi:TRAP transporter large permease subunit [Aliiroseovarius subalbicans]|uniref:TRAP transporter large permease subunit n=1 Tax=Aliiroseovarius subalbicans TaxID=2925840 RepID=UPI001F578664|nr:TRAP transporter large permease subunit [Aliiroseovarius subalbicans]MCI2400001.1 TRAP transporter large permease subunit [Aliiroseovarius subalbicans]